MALGDPVPGNGYTNCGNSPFVGPACKCYAALVDCEAAWQIADRRREQAEYVIGEVCKALGINIEFPLMDHDVGYLIWELTKDRR